ncbi:CCA tRNA nucleotidyltransferase [Kocuria rhizophila]|nr:CCA tRNA nucleotidyltransferase [Kocuria rhizophila]
MGGPVRDLLLGGRPGPGLHQTTVHSIRTWLVIRDWADAHWRSDGLRTIGMRKAGMQLDMTTYRAEAYDHSRKSPPVAFGDDLTRTAPPYFTVNAMALRLPDMELADPFGASRTCTCVLRILRPGGTPSRTPPPGPRAPPRSTSQPGLYGGGTGGSHDRHGQRIETVRGARAQELVKPTRGAHPRRGVELMVDTGLAQIGAARGAGAAARDGRGPPPQGRLPAFLTVMEQAVQRRRTRRAPSRPGLRAALRRATHDVGSATPRLRAVRRSASATTRRWRPAHTQADEGAALLLTRRSTMVTRRRNCICVSTDMERRTYTNSRGAPLRADAGSELERLHRLTRSDVTTRQPAQGRRLAGHYDELAAAHRAAGGAGAARRPCARAGRERQGPRQILGIPPGPQVVGLQDLLELRLDEGARGYEARSGRPRWAREEGHRGLRSQRRRRARGGAPRHPGVVGAGAGATGPVPARR